MSKFCRRSSIGSSRSTGVKLFNLRSMPCSGSDEVLAVTLADIERAKTIVLGRRRLSARDALHAAVMERQGIDRVLSFDRGFDGLPGVTRLAG